MIIVVCPLQSNRSNRWDFNKVSRETEPWRDNPILLDKLDEYKFMPATKLQRKLRIMACNEGHMNILKRIIKDDLTNVVICEDDSVIDYPKLEEFLQGDIPDGFIYLGGRFDYPKIKDWDKQRSVDKYMEGKSVNGFNEVKDDFIITGSHGYFIKNKDIAQYILDNCKGTTGKYKSTLVDVLYSKIKGLNKYYVYPSIIEIEYLPSLLGHNCEDSTWKNYIK